MVYPSLYYPEAIGCEFKIRIIAPSSGNPLREKPSNTPVCNHRGSPKAQRPQSFIVLMASFYYNPKKSNPGVTVITFRVASAALVFSVASSGEHSCGEIYA